MVTCRWVLTSGLGSKEGGRDGCVRCSKLCRQAPGSPNVSFVSQTSEVNNTYSGELQSISSKSNACSLTQSMLLDLFQNSDCGARRIVDEATCTYFWMMSDYEAASRNAYARVRARQEWRGTCSDSSFTARHMTWLVSAY